MNIHDISSEFPDNFSTKNLKCRKKATFYTLNLYYFKNLTR